MADVNIVRKTIQSPLECARQVQHACVCILSRCTFSVVRTARFPHPQAPVEQWSADDVQAWAKRVAGLPKPCRKALKQYTGKQIVKLTPEVRFVYDC